MKVNYMKEVPVPRDHDLAKLLREKNAVDNYTHTGDYTLWFNGTGVVFVMMYKYGQKHKAWVFEDKEI
jgi:hypothetical protein